MNICQLVAPAIVGTILGVTTYCIFYGCSKILAKRLSDLNMDQLVVEARLREMRRAHSLLPAFLIAVASGFLVWWTQVFVSPSSQNPTFAVAVLVQFIGAGYFIYQLMAGALFATTSISIDAVRSTIEPHKIRISVTLERGSNWLAVIVADAYYVVTPDAPITWHTIGFPRRERDDSLRLGPNEKTATTIVLTRPPELDVTIVAKVEFYSILWPVAGESFAKTIVLASAPR